MLLLINLSKLKLLQQVRFSHSIVNGMTKSLGHFSEKTEVLASDQVGQGLEYRRPHMLVRASGTGQFGLSTHCLSWVCPEDGCQGPPASRTALAF